MDARAEITAAGLVSALGAGLEECLDALVTGHVAGPDPRPLETTIPHPPPAFRVLDAASPDPGLTRTSLLALRALDQALAGRDLTRTDPRRIGVCIGTTVGCSFNGEAFWRAYRGGEDPGLGAVERYLENDLAPLVARRVGATGPAMTVVTACASGTDAIGTGASWIAAGTCDIVIAGGADELERFAYHGFHCLKNMAPEACRPFDRARCGLNLGEGAGIVILERPGDASGRTAPAIGRVLGYASASDAYHPTSPHPEGRGLRQALGRALGAAGLAPGDVGFVNAHGTATVENDRVEGRVLAEMLPGVPVISTKGTTGHTLGAAGAIEAILTLLCLGRRVIPATVGFSEPDPECVTVPTRAIAGCTASTAVSTSLAFGGTNSVLVLGGP